MKFGYARVSTREQNLDMQLDALKEAGCDRIYQDVASGAKSARPALDELLGQLRSGDVLVIWKLDRMGRSLKHLVELVSNLMERKVGLQSLNDPVDTTSAQGRLVFNIFASLAEFERELIRERTNAGLSAARARGRMGGRPKGLPKKAQATAAAAETLYRDGVLSVAAITQKLNISRRTLYSYLRHRGVPISPYTKSTQVPRPSVAPSASSPAVNVATILLTMRIQNNNKHGRNRKRTVEYIEHTYLNPYGAKKTEVPGQYALGIPCSNEMELDGAVTRLLKNVGKAAIDRDCFSDTSAMMPGTPRIWSH